ncbi:amidase [Alternaria panax]|uniref:Amidase n=1 Tax=Alternaria panax TaxID=48097 RepID=A0AAD4FD55_9PLEO|nr:amidase [Alternaria panax]
MPNKMRAAQIMEYEKPYELHERAIPQCGDHDLLIQVYAAGFCHSDLQVWNGQFPAASLPMIPSHEPAGKIAQIGANVQGSWKVGDRVGVLNYKNACGGCAGCRQHSRRSKRPDPRFCQRRIVAGFRHDGAFAEYMLADPNTTVHLPDGVSFEQGAPLMCAGATVWGALRKLSPQVQPGDAVAVVGIGGLGQLGVQFSKALGYRTIAMDNRDEGRQLALDLPDHLKPDLVMDSTTEDADQKISEFTSGEGLAGIVVCTDSIQANAWCLQQLGNGGVMVPLGLPKDKWQFDSEVMVFHELTIKGSYVASAEEVESMLKVVAKHGISSHLTVLGFSEIPSLIGRYLHASMKGRLVINIKGEDLVAVGDAESVLESIGVTNGIPANESQDYHQLLAAVHDVAEHILQLPDYTARTDTEKYPRENIRRPSADEQDFGNAWAHKFLIRGNSQGSLLQGKTLCLKDNVAVAGVPQFFGTDAIPAWTPNDDATVVRRALDAGADVVGTTICENFCNSTSSFTSAQGTVYNPYARGYSAGGSTSGGSAVVGGGLVDIAIGADQGGSIRVPSSFCGCVGLKPTHGLVPYTGISSGDAINDHAGPIARSVSDVALCLDAISGKDDYDDRTLGAPIHGSTQYAKSLRNSVAGLKIGVLKEGFEHRLVNEEVKSTVRKAIQSFERLGATVEEVSLPLHLEGPAIWTIQQRIAGTFNMLGYAHGRRGLFSTAYETARQPWTNESFQKLFPSTKNTIINGLSLMQNYPGLYAKTMNLAQQLRDSYEMLFEDYDLIVMPTTPFVAPPNIDWKRGEDAPMDALKPSMGITINTAIFDVTGHPAMSLPVGFSPSTVDSEVRLPVGMQLVGGLWQEQKILNAAFAWESANDWKKIGIPKDQESRLSTKL